MPVAAPHLPAFDLVERLRSRIAHDLGGRLTVIVGYASLLGADRDEHDRAASREIVSAAEHVSGALADLELVLGLASGAIEARPAPVDLLEIVDAAVLQVRRRSEHPLDASSDSSWPQAFADPVHLTRAVKQVLTAACEYASADARISVAPGSECDAAQLQVTGANLTDLVDADLRLALACALLELGGGSLEFEGDVATIRVPLAASQATAA
jgi:signal transduction histidine kinase